jgi:hypothetical protein
MLQHQKQRSLSIPYPEIRRILPSGNIRFLPPNPKTNHPQKRTNTRKNNQRAILRPVFKPHSTPPPPRSRRGGRWMGGRNRGIRGYWLFGGRN